MSGIWCYFGVKPLRYNNKEMAAQASFLNSLVMQNSGAEWLNNYYGKNRFIN